jgi:Ca2+ transporting ATPase
MEKAHTKTVNEILIELDIESVSKGLSDDQVIGHRTKYGRNELPKEPTTPLWQLILKQFDDTLVKILVASAIISTVLAFFEDDFGLHSLVEPGVRNIIIFKHFSGYRFDPCT